MLFLCLLSSGLSSLSFFLGFLSSSFFLLTFQLSSFLFLLTFELGGGLLLLSELAGGFLGFPLLLF